MAGRQLGDAYITISPDTRLFRTQADAQITKELAGFSKNVRIGADTKSAQLAVASFQKRIGELQKQLSNLRADAGTKGAESKIAGVQARVLALAKQMGSLTMSADGRKLDAQILAKIAEVRKLEAQMSGLQMDANSTKLALKIAQKEAEAKRLEEQLHDMDMDADVSVLEAKFNAVHSELALLKRDASDIDLVMSNVAALRNIGVAKAELATLQSQAKDLQLGTNIDPAKLVAAEAALLGIEHVVGELGKKDLPEASTAMGAFLRSTKAGSTAAAAGWRLLTGHITLMGGALNSVLPKMFTSVAVWHLLADAVIELIAVWVPAIIAVTAFGVAGADAGKEIYRRMQAVHTVMDATGQAVPPLTKNFDHLAAAVRPQVYQLFGDALVIMAKRGGAFNQVALGTGRVLDQLAARFVVAVTSGTGVNKFMEHAVEDVAKLGDSIGNFGGIFGAVFRAVPGYAEILLKVGDWMTKVIEAFTQASEPVIAVGLALHGFFIYGGAAVTMTFALVAGLVKVLGAFGKFNEAITLVGFNALKKFGLAIVGAIANVITYTGAVISMAVSDGIAAASTALLSDAMLVLSRVPVAVWVTIAAVALTSLAIAIGRSKDEAQRFNGTMQDLVKNASLGNVIPTIQSAQAATSARLASTTRDLNKAVKENKVVFAGRAGALNSNGEAIQNLGNAQRHYTEGLVQLTDQQKLVNTRFGVLSKTYGGNAQALGILNAAGITTAQITDKSASAWAIIQVQVEATTRAYRAMGSQAGVLGNDLDVMGRTLTDQYQAIQKLNQGWSAFIADVTGTQGSFDTVAQGFFTLNDHAGKLTFSLGKLKVKYADQKAAIDSLTPAGVALNQAFTDQVVNVDKLFASWRTAGIAGSQFTSGVQAAIGPLVKYARGSQEATAQLVALAQEAGYQGPVSMAALTKWLGNTHGATQKLKDITNQATTQEALLTGAMRDQGSFIANQLIGNINNSILAYTGVKKAVTDYGTAVAKTGKGSDTASQAMTKAVGALVASGLAMGDNAQTIGALVAKVFGISMPAAMKKVRQAMDTMVAGLPPAQKKFEQFAISGLDMTRGEADQLWKKFRENNFGALVTKTDASRTAFDKLASKGLGITRDAADQLWKHLRQQYLDELVRKGDITRGKFIQLATKGLDLTRTAAQHLWDTLHRQQLTDAYNKSNTTRSGFEKLAAQLGVTKGYADRLWTSLHKLPRNVPIVIHETGIGKWSVSGPTSKTGVAHGPQNIGAGPGGFAAGGLVRAAARKLAGGGFVNYGSGPVADDVPAMLSRGELVVPANVVQSGAVDHLRGMLPGFAAGGAVTGYGRAGPGAWSGLGPWTSHNLNADTNQMTAVVESRMDAAMRAAVKAAQAAMNAQAAGTAGGGVQRWRPLVLKALAMEGLSAGLANDVLYQMQTESGGRQFAINLTDSNAARGTPSKGLMQVIAPTFARWHWPGTSWDIYDPLANIAAAINYSAHGRGFGSGYGQMGSGHGYALGGLVRAMAAGGLAGEDYATGLASGGVAGLRSKLAAEQAGERAKYSGLRHAFAAGPARYRTKTVTGELATLATRQAAEQAAYAALSGSGLTTTRLHHLGATARAEIRTAADKGLSKLPGGHPGFAADLRKYLGQISATASGTVAGGGGSGGGGSGGVTGGGTAVVRAALAREQSQEISRYASLTRAASAALAAAKKGSWLYSHKTTIRNELGTLSRRQAAERAAYNRLGGKGLTAHNRSLLATAARAEAATARDKALSRAEPGWTAGLRYWLAALNATALHGTRAPGGPGPVGGGPGGHGPGGAQQKLAFSAWLAKLKAAQAREAADYRGLFAAFYSSLLHARPGSWIYKNRTGVRERLYAVAIKQNAEAAAYSDLLRHSTGSVPDLNALPGRIGKLGSRARAEAGSLQPSLLGHLPGGHPGWVKALQAQLNALAKLTAVPPFNPPWAPGNLGPSHSAPGGVLRFDTGRNVLQPGMNLAWNGTGRLEPLSRTGAGGGSGAAEIHLHVHNNGVIGSQQQTDAWLQASLNRMARTGYLAQAVSQALGR